jgi:mono/diheme cytochrome c family protein
MKFGLATLALAGIALTTFSAQEANKTVWNGVFSTQQAARGKEQYTSRCSMCHLEDLRGDGMAPALVGDSFMLQWSDLTAGELFGRIRASMPQDSPRSLTDEVYSDILAYIFEANHFPAGEQDLAHDLGTLKAITIAKRPSQN